MGDAADILGLKKEKKVDGFVSAIGGSDPKRGLKKRDVPTNPPNMSREVFKLLGGQQGIRAAGGFSFLLLLVFK
jgi:hypothetical protein